ncbi:peptidyl-prolyl cis-trans isomerase FKBP4-like [Bradysia coprophila]|uniref:peptidyl-prolyl cis-trans isomerase FKBP4-like n=1 Tax=Bradysia coprophila TaxID=38358 RepID=UPI00187DD5EA|nr:peptidyl-prolyl cis-trans isomerase FKBP4-like [Bradysia coprophila]
MSSLNEVHISGDDSKHGANECDITKNLDGGILKQIVREGKYYSHPKLDDDVLIHVAGTLKKGNKLFYNSRQLGKPWKTKLHDPFSHESSELPKALDIGLRTMKKHEIAIFTCLPNYCYKQKAYKHRKFLCEVPANSEIVFEVELLDFDFGNWTDGKDGGVMLIRHVKRGYGDSYPTYNSQVSCTLSSFSNFKGSQTMYCNLPDGGQWDSTKDLIDELALRMEVPYRVAESGDFSWTLGEGELERIPKGIEMAVANMMVGQKAVFMIRYDYLKEMLSEQEYRKYQKNSEFHTFMITLRSCVRAKASEEMTGEERFKEGLECKLKGNHYLSKRSNVRLALERFKQAIDLLETSIDLDGPNSDRDDLLFTCYLNISIAYFDAKTPELCDEYLKKALKMKPDNEKAMYRTGLLLMHRKCFEEAKTQFGKLLAHYPDNKAAINRIGECDRLASQQSLYKAMGKALIG